MKILAVHLRNLNSLVGSWTIDFTAPEYAAAGIFAITGPTGAGKSTILDAICLALFARTPRLGHISKASNEIMSRRAGDCFAEVEFETRQGRYRCHWGQHRARRSPEGELQPPRHEIVDAGSGKVLETRSKEVGRRVEQVTGMDYDRFSRSILLAQGSFAAFLEADADQRAPILEQITGTAIYSQISIAVHERTSQERQQTAGLREGLGTLVLLDPAEEQALAAGIDEGVAAVVPLQQRLAQLGEALHRLKAIGVLRQQLGESDRQLLELARRRQESQADLLALERGQRAQALLAEYTRLTQVQERLAALRAQGAQLRTTWEGLQQEQQRLSADHDRSCRQLEHSLAIQGREGERMKVVRELDLRIHERKKAINQQRLGREETERQQQGHLGSRQELHRRQAELAAEVTRLELFFREHGGDSLLVEHLAGFRQQLLLLTTRAEHLARLTTMRAQNQLARVEADRHQQGLLEAERQARLGLAALRQRQQPLLQERDRLLAGKEVAAWRAQLAEGEQRLRQMEQVGELLGQEQALAEHLAALAQRLEEVRAREGQKAQELGALEERRLLQQQLVDQCERNHQLSLRIRSYEEERRRLVEGDACPLCGATHHPWADGQPLPARADTHLVRARAELEGLQTAIAQLREAQVSLGKDREYTGAALGQGRQQQQTLGQQLQPLLVVLAGAVPAERLARTVQLLTQGQVEVEAERQRLQAIEQLEAALAAVQAQLEQATSLHGELLPQVQAGQHAGETLAAEGRRLEAQAREEQVQLDGGQAELLAQLRPLGIDVCPPAQAEALLRQLEARQQAWKDQQQLREQLRQEQTRLQAELDKVDLLLAAGAKTLAQQGAELETLERAEAGLLAERFELYGDRDANVEEQRLQTLVRQAQAAEVASRTRLTAIDKEQHGLQEQLRLGREEQAALVPQGRSLEAGLLGRLQGAGFGDLADFRSALLAPATLAELDQRREALASEQAVLASRRAEQAQALEREEQLHRGQKDQVALEAEQEERHRQLAALQQRIGADRERLAVNSQRKQQGKEQRAVLARQQQEQERWELLHQLIGSADGKKFRVFAQGLTFELMISHANRQLGKMNDRYILLRDPKEPLALQVIDNYQAGEVRSTRNLSGGESFLVSLALSLGLSAMASHNVRVDSLFLDEGFGTLDEEALETALQSLAELQHDGKLIGVISHVPLLQDRIEVRIQVLPGPGGRSRLLGPGCSRSA